MKTEDRQKTCPFFLRLHIASTAPTVEDAEKGFPEAKEMQLYTWHDATLKELSFHVQLTVPEANDPQCTLHFTHVKHSRSGTLVLQEIGLTRGRQAVRPDDDRTLGMVDFTPGDLLFIRMDIYKREKQIEKSSEQPSAAHEGEDMPVDDEKKEEKKDDDEKMEKEGADEQKSG
eukprot:Sspe_Gene.35962::Locus_17416_Transcript_1_1_Confidence_1.000_Length_801::g.35962::m.35962/K14324/SAP18; histone deacetylase complex subunit SAP18